jgi:peroxiredoxin
VFDLAGNLAEWAEVDSGKPTRLGGSMAGATGAACNNRTFSTPAGSRNRTTGFRCCADMDVRAEPVVAADVRANVETVLDLAVPEFVVEDVDGNEIRSANFKGSVTLVNFFASWCGPCKKEFPHLVDYAKEFADRGFKIVGVCVDTVAKSSIDFAKGFDANFPIVTDPDARLKGKFIVYEMPATFLVDREGIVRYRVTGFSGDDQEREMRAEVEKLLSASAKP